MKQNSLKKNFLYNVFYQILVIIIPLITSPYLTRVIGADGLGVYTYTQAYAHYFVLFILLGLANYGNREIAKVRDNKENVSRTFWEIYVFQLVMLIAVSLVYIITVVAAVRNNNTIYWLQFIYILSAGFDINWCCFGLEKFKLTVVRNSIIKVASAVAIFVFVHSPDDLWIYTFIITGTTLLSQLIVWPFILKDIKFIRPSLRGVLSRIKPNLLLFLPVVAVSLYTIMDKLMLGMMDTKTEVAYYSYAERIIQIPLSFITALGTVMLPRTSNMLNNGKIKESNVLMQKSMQFSMLLSIGSTFGVMVIANDLIPWYYGADFERCASFTIWLAPVIIFTAWNTVIRTQYVIPMGLDKVYLITVSTGAIINLTINSILIPELRGTGAVIGTITAQFIVCFIQYLLLRKKIDYKVFVKDTIVFLFMGVAMGIIVTFIPDFINGDIWNIILKFILEIIIYCLLTIGYLLLKGDYWLVNNVVKILPRRSK